MNTAIQQHSALESFLLFRGIELHGLDPAAFARISDTLQNNFLVRNNSNYDAARLRPESLQELFLNLLWEELKSESDNFVRSDGELSELSPASKKRKLQPPPPPTLRDARHHISKIEAIYLKLQDIYIRNAIKDIRKLETDYDQVEGDIRRILEDVNRVNDASPAATQPTKTSNGVVQDYAVKRDLGQVNGATTAATSKPSPKPQAQISPPIPPPIPTSIPTPSPQATTQALPEAARWQPITNGSLPVSHAPLQAPVGAPSPAPVAAPVLTPGPTPAPAPPALAPAPVPAPMTASSSAVAQTLSPAPVSIPATSPTPISTGPALAPVPVTASNLGQTVPTPSLSHSVRSPRPGQQSLPRPQPTQPAPSQDAPKAPNGTPQVLQPPRGIPFQLPPQQFTPPPVADGLQRPDHVTRPKQSQVPLPSVTQQDAQAALKWEPFYKGNPNSPMPSIPQQQQQQQPQHIHHSQSPIPTSQPSQSTQPPQLLQTQRPPQAPQQHMLHPVPRPLQPQTSKPLQQQVLSPAPQSTAHAQYQASHTPQPPQQHYQHPQHPQHTPQPQLAQAPQLAQHLPPSHLAQIRPAPEVQSFVQQSRPPPYTHGGQSRVNQPPHPHPPYQNYTPSGVRSPVNHSPLPSPTNLHPRAGQLAAPQSHQQPQSATQPQALQPLQPPPPFPQRNPSSGPPSPALPLGDSQRGYNSPYQQHSRGFVPDRLQQSRSHAVTTPRQPGPVFAPIHSAPHTPAPSFPLRLLHTGSGTTWSKTSTPSTPKNGSDWRFNETESPTPEPLSPVLKKSALPSVAPRNEIKNETPAAEPPSQLPAPLPPVETPNAKRKPGRPRGSQKAHDETPSTVVPDEPRQRSPEKPQDQALEEPSENLSREPSEESPQHRSTQQKSPAKEAPKLNVDLEPTKIKDEVTTPNHASEAWDTTADESVAGRRQPKRQTKRKREDMSPTPVQTPVESQVPVIPEASGVEPNTVLWTRSFHKVSASAMEQIVRHRLANMFAVPIRERDAPGYHKRIIQPQDLKSIRAAIMTGNRAAAQTAAALPGGDPGTSTVALPVSEELIPPKAIINSNQLDRELAHMFANAIMYNPDHGHGPGPVFLVQEDDEQNKLDGPDEDQGNAAAHQSGHHGQEHILGYKVDEYGVVHDTRAMFQDVDKWLSELRSAEIERGAKPPATGTSTRQASVAGGLQGEQSFSSNTATSGTAGGGAADTMMDDADEQTATEPETTVKRRRTTRNA